jgi:PLP dependent protein
MSSSDTGNIAKNLMQIQHNISKICQKYHRDPEKIQLLAVSKTKSAAQIRQAYIAGQTIFGENYLQESIDKIYELRDLEIEWHFIGTIQSNKTRELAQHFSWVHSVDRLKIAHRLSQQRPQSLPPLNICLQVNISNENSKSGFSAEEVIAVANEVSALKNLNLRGLMVIPAKANSLSEQRKIFSRTHSLFNVLNKKHPQFDTLSMGMSGDMEAAIAEGSTMLRIGTAIFGARDRSKL